MKKRHKKYIKINIVSVFFIIVSMISVTMAWFAYSGIASVGTEVNVKAWYVEFEKDNTKQNNNINISLTDLYPGMQTIEETVVIKNKGDSKATVNYNVLSANILDEDIYEVNNELDTFELEDALSHNYPFHINMSLTKNYADATTGQSEFKVAISWPLDGGDNAADSYWGNKAYELKNNGKSSINIVINLNAEQYLENPSDSDVNYNLGDVIYYDILNNEKCSNLSNTCFKTIVIDENNTLDNNYITLMPSISDNYLSTGNYVDIESIINNYPSNSNVIYRSLEVNDLLKIISKDINNSYINYEGLSPIILGNLKYSTRLIDTINEVKNSNGYFTFNDTYSYLVSNSCYYTNSEYQNNVFGVKKENNINKIKSIEKGTTCKIVPVIIIDKNYYEGLSN